MVRRGGATAEPHLLIAEVGERADEFVVVAALRTQTICWQNFFKRKWRNCRCRSPYKSADLYERCIIEVSDSWELAATASSCM